MSCAIVKCFVCFLFTMALGKHLHPSSENYWQTEDPLDETSAKNFNMETNRSWNQKENIPNKIIDIDIATQTANNLEKKLNTLRNFFQKQYFANIQRNADILDESSNLVNSEDPTTFIFTKSIGAKAVLESPLATTNTGVESTSTKKALINKIFRKRTESKRSIENESSLENSDRIRYVTRSELMELEQREHQHLNNIKQELKNLFELVQLLRDQQYVMALLNDFDSKPLVYEFEKMNNNASRGKLDPEEQEQLRIYLEFLRKHVNDTTPYKNVYYEFLPKNNFSSTVLPPTNINNDLPSTVPSPPFIDSRTSYSQQFGRNFRNITQNNEELLDLKKEVGNLKLLVDQFLQEEKSRSIDDNEAKIESELDNQKQEIAILRKMVENLTNVKDFPSSLQLPVHIVSELSKQVENSSLLREADDEDIQDKQQEVEFLKEELISLTNRLTNFGKDSGKVVSETVGSAPHLNLKPAYKPTKLPPPTHHYKTPKAHTFPQLKIPPIKKVESTMRKSSEDDDVERLLRVLEGENLEFNELQKQMDAIGKIRAKEPKAADDDVNDADVNNALQKLLKNIGQLTTEPKASSAELDENDSTEIKDKLEKLERQLQAKNKESDLTSQLEKLEKQIKKLNRKKKDDDLDAVESKSDDDGDMETMKAELKKLQREMKKRAKKKAKKQNKSLDDEDDIGSELKHLQSAINELKQKDDDVSFEATESKDNSDTRFQLMLTKLLSQHSRPQKRPSHARPHLNQLQIEALKDTISTMNGNHGYHHTDNNKDCDYGNTNSYQPSYSSGQHQSYSSANSPSGQYYDDLYNSNKYQVPNAYPNYDNSQYNKVQYPQYSQNTKYSAANGPYGISSNQYGKYDSLNTPYSANQYPNIYNSKYGNAIPTYGSGITKKLNSQYNNFLGPYAQNKPNANVPYSKGNYAGPSQNLYNSAPQLYGSLQNLINAKSYDNNYAPSNAAATYDQASYIKPSGLQKGYGKPSSTDYKNPDPSYNTHGVFEQLNSNYQQDKTNYSPSDQTFFPANPQPQNYGTANAQNYNQGTYSDTGNSPQSYTNSQQNINLNDPYGKQKVDDLKTQIYGLQTVINNLNRPEYTQKPEDKDTIYKLDQQITDLKDVINNLSQDYSNSNGANVPASPTYSDNTNQNYQAVPSDYQTPAPSSDAYASPGDAHYQKKDETYAAPAAKARSRWSRAVDEDTADEDEPNILTSLITNVLQMGNSEETEEKQTLPRSHDDLQQRLQDLKKQLDSKVKPNFEHRSSAYQRQYPPQIYHQRPPYQQPVYQPVYQIQSYDKKEEKKIKKKSKKLDVFGKIFSKILDKIIEKVGVAIPIIAKSIFGIGVDELASYGTDGYSGYGGYNVQGGYKSSGIFGYIPMIILKLLYNLSYFVKQLQRNKFIKSFFVPMLITAVVAGAVVFLTWWLQPNDEYSSGYGYSKIGYGGNSGYSNDYENKNGYTYGGSSEAYRNNNNNNNNPSNKYYQNANNMAKPNTGSFSYYNKR